jgi:outer membrane protein insertion porin family
MTPLRIGKVKFVGNQRTHHSVLEQELQMAYDADTAFGVLEGLSKGMGAIKRMDIFDSVNVSCDVAEGKPGVTDVTFHVVEKGFLKLKAETYVQDGHTGVEASFTLRNALGLGESFDVVTSETTNTKRVIAHKSRLFGFPVQVRASGSQEHIDRTFSSSLNETRTGGIVELSTFDGTHKLGVESCARDVLPVRAADQSKARGFLRSRFGKGKQQQESGSGSGSDSSSVDPYAYACSAEVLNLAQPSMKNSIFHQWTKDKRDNPALPTTGSLWRTRTELAGFGGDASFVKADVDHQRFKPLWRGGPIAGVSAHLGCLLPTQALLATVWDDAALRDGAGRASASGSVDFAAASGGAADDVQASRVSHFSDRYFMGGPMMLRGFTHRGAGPHSRVEAPMQDSTTDGSAAPIDSGDSLGGDITWSAAASLSALVVPRANLHVMGFVNAGNLVGYDFASVRNLLRGTRSSVGFGLVLPTAVGRIEATYSYVLRCNPRDQRKGFQLGIGMDFM